MNKPRLGYNGAKHKSLLYTGMALSRNEYNKICESKVAKEIWESLNINYEGIKDV